jgi:hypothetical protein
MPVYKATLVVTVLFEAPDRLAASSWIGEPSLEELAAEMDRGDYVGTHRETELVEVAPEKIAEELRAVGNDGSFFSTEG